MKKSDLIKWLVDNMSFYGDEELDFVKVNVFDKTDMYDVVLKTKDQKIHCHLVTKRTNKGNDTYD